MRIFLFFLFTILFTANASSQNIISLKNNKTGKTRILKPGSKLHFRTIHDSIYIKARIVQIKDSVIVFYIPDFEEEMPLMDVRIAELKDIKKSTAFHAFTRTAGAVLLPVGSYLFLNGALSLARGGSFDKDKATVFTLTGLGLSVAGILPYIIRPKEYHLKTEWTLTVKKGKK